MRNNEAKPGWIERGVLLHVRGSNRFKLLCRLFFLLQLGRAGEAFWQAESYDHWVRDQDEWNRIRT